MIYDCLMIGAGPANLAAAIYTSREDLKTIIFEKETIGGLAALTARIDNYPGFASGVDGLALANELQGQAERFGAEIQIGEVVSITSNSGIFDVVTTVRQQPFQTKTVLVGSGSKWKKLGVEGESQFYGVGIHHCATCDGAFYRDKDIIVVGGGNSAAQESLFLTKFARKIDILLRSDQWRASDILVRQVQENPKIKIHYRHKLIKVEGEGKTLDSATVSGPDSSESKWKTSAVFIFIGLLPVTGYLSGSGVKLDERGFVLTDNDFQTNVDGIFAAGDVRSGATMQIASAIGEGASAALAIRHYLEDNH